MPLEQLSTPQVIALGEAMSELSMHPGWTAFQQYLAEQHFAVGDAALSGEGPPELSAEQKIIYWRGYRAAVDDVRKAPGRIIADAERLKQRKPGGGR